MLLHPLCLLTCPRMLSALSHWPCVALMPPSPSQQVSSRCCSRPVEWLLATLSGSKKPTQGPSSCRTSAELAASPRLKWRRGEALRSIPLRNRSGKGLCAGAIGTRSQPGKPRALPGARSQVWAMRWEAPHLPSPCPLWHMHMPTGGRPQIVQQGAQIKQRTAHRRCVFVCESL